MAAETNAHEKCPSCTHISTHSATSAKTTRYTPQYAVQDTGASCASCASDRRGYSNLLSARSEAPCGRSRFTRSGAELTLQQV